MEDGRNGETQRAHINRNPKRHISQMSLILCRKISTVQCLVWCLGLQMWSGSELDQTSSFGNFNLPKLFSCFKHSL